MPRHAGRLGELLRLGRVRRLGRVLRETGDHDHHALLDVETGERRLPILIPGNAG